MNLDLILSAGKIIDNRYLLCRVTSQTVRRLHFTSFSTQDAILDALSHVVGHGYKETFVRSDSCSGEAKTLR